MEDYEELKKQKKFRSAMENLREIEKKLKPYSEEKYYERKKIEKWEVFNS